ncbi:OLC1v1008757C1 [Oldenlandia corymbosa var. corymbosa]|uniref:OLC1v1008757C1 n=1 Tax=Oldenlandia corymbosa var. corymbosa TaxID=529605 RepID=A0AAV1DMH6_OLDCO|nr:OLC1v1008757C1 [Oldenlandia corymbosa var. corymbosa]
MEVAKMFEPISTYSVQGFLSSDFGPENVLEMHSNVDLDFVSPEKDFSLDVQMEEESSIQGRPESLFVAEQEQQLSYLKKIEDELMDEEESGLTDLLLMGAEAVESGNVGCASMVAMKLNNLLSYHEETRENPVNRLALYFTQGLLNKIEPELFAAEELEEDHNLNFQGRNAILAFQLLQELSPLVKFAHFTANQAILEATEAHQEIHVIDFDIMEGIQWPSLMVDIAGRGDGISLRITAIVHDKRSSTSSHIHRTGDRLREFANSINVAFSFDQIVITKAEDFEGIKQGKAALVANCMMNQLHMPSRKRSLVKMFFNGLKKLAPKMVVLVQEELFNFCKVQNMSFVEFFFQALNHYSALLDSIRSGFCRGGYEFAFSVIEKEFLRMRILDCMKQFPCGMTDELRTDNPFSREVGFRAISMSSCNVTQARHLVSLFNGDFWVQNEPYRLNLCWKSRPLTTASIWVPTA